MLDFLELAAVTRQSGIGLGPSLDRARFPAAGPIWESVGSDAAGECVEQFLTLALGAGLEQRFATAPSGGQCAGETHALQRGAVATSGFEHHAPHEVVHQEVEADFPGEVLGRLAAQLVHLEAKFEVT
jgi:hypothetical protein